MSTSFKGIPSHALSPREGGEAAAPSPLGREALRQAVDHAAHYLPIQGPIGVFIHHNTLHAFQHLPFEEAVVKAAELFGTEPFMQEQAYRSELARGRVREEDLIAVLEQEENANVVPGLLDRRRLRYVMLVPGLRAVEGQRIEWLLGEGGWSRSFRNDLPAEARASLANDDPRTMWEVCVSRARPLQLVEGSKFQRPKNAVLSSKGIDLDAIIHPVLISLVSTYLDQGVAHWSMPSRYEGLLHATRLIMGQRVALAPAGLEGIGATLSQQTRRKLNAEDTVLDALQALGIDERDTEAFIVAELLALPGWAGLIRKLEGEPELAVHERVRCSLMEFLAVRLTLLVAAVRNAMGDTRSWRSIHIPAPAPVPLEREAHLFDAAQLLGLSSSSLRALRQEDYDRLCDEIERFDDMERRRVWHLAYERRHERMVLLPLAHHRQLPPLMRLRDRYAAEVFFCIDEREESVRRALEEVDPEVRTYGAAGFFGCAISFTGHDEAHALALCPVVVKPMHQVHERSQKRDRTLAEERQRLRRLWARFAHEHRMASRSLLGGWFGTAITGATAVVPLLLWILRPLTWGKMRDRTAHALVPQPMTELAFHREEPGAKDPATGRSEGFTVTEMADRVGGLLGTVGLRSNMARLVVVIGHGSTSLNNPHESAHDCGACGGSRGGPNGRLFAAMANVPEVRALLRERGIIIPEDTWFIGGYHDTSNDDVDLYDLDRSPETHTEDLHRVRMSLDKARAMSAHERARRFEAAGTRISTSEGLRHVQGRAEHLAEPRPEYGHCTNAVCIVGKRATTQGLFFDRRAFLVSYDEACDPENKALAGVLGAVIPVCGGISLEYYFSFVDNEGYGCGTKLPHNVTGLVGVMNGYQGDLRTGLPWQMVEIHEPVRILFVVETTPERLLPIIMANPELKEFVMNRWIRLSTIDPVTGVIMVFRDGVFEKLSGEDELLPQSPSSRTYYEGRMEHLPVARIGSPEHAIV
ncbi:MAG: DUF2309 domain-containing protein [Flavobacteriales bacterium]|nr:DUF2309 domain-containing protein [Flavobacteriales bacterium]